MSTVRRFERLDFKASDLAKPEVSQEGFWKLDGKVARTGVQVYQDGSGGTRHEMRHAEHVKASLDSFALVPLTNQHPSSLVKPENASKYIAGAVGKASYADGWVKAPITVWTKDAIDAVKSGRAQLSVGYTCKLVHEPGEHEGQKYDCFQTDIVVNHVALVDAARAGPEARLRLDSGDMATPDFFTTDEDVLVSSKLTTASDQRETSSMPHKMKLGTFEIEVADANTQAIIEGAIGAARKDAEDKLSVETKRADAAVADLAKAVGEKTALQAKADGLEAAVKADAKCDECGGTGKVDGADCKNCGGTGKMKADSLLNFDERTASRARSDARAVALHAADRAKLIAQAMPHLSANENLDAKSNVDIKKLVLTKLDASIKLDGKDDVYVAHRYDFEMEQRAKAKLSPLERVRLVQDGAAPADTTVVEVKDASPDAKASQTKHYDSQYFKKAKAK